MPEEAETARCNREIDRCLAHLAEGGPEDIGAYVGLTDWQEERRLIAEQGYASFLARKRKVHHPTGFDVAALGCEALYPFQKHIVKWALKLGRSAIFADCGLGKTLMQLEWARQVHHFTGKPVLILAPLAVSKQTQREGERFGYAVTIARHQSDVCGVSITNYEMLDHFVGGQFGGVVLDESSILKSYSGATRNAIIEAFGATPFRLACTATPSPNDYMELGNHSEFLGAMSRAGMLATFFNHDGGETSKWRIKGHAEKAFWRWVSSWAVMIARPSDIGYSDLGFTLPELRRHHHAVESEAQDGFLFPVEASSLSERRESRRESLDARVERAVELVSADSDQWLIWGELNAETDAAESAITGAVQVSGSDPDEHKEKSMLGFADGSVPILVTKPKIGGFGMNWQQCHQMIFLGLTDSYESTYQAERRCWRYGQQKPVDVHILTTDRDAAIIRNIERKRKQAEEMTEQMVQAVKEAHED